MSINRAKFEDYDSFVKKFEPKKTTDDCYTPANIYDTVVEFVEQEFGVNRENFVRPFYPGGDYERYEYTPGAVVVDNPPFSILSQIIKFYIERNIKFFLFAPNLTCFNLLNGTTDDITVYPVNAKLTYENGANINTSFVSNMDPGYIVRTLPELSKKLIEENRKNELKTLNVVPKYTYPAEVLTGALVGKWSAHGVDYRLPRGEGIFIRALDEQRAKGKTVFGAGLLLSERGTVMAKQAARESAEDAARRAAGTIGPIDVITWSLSDRERAIVKGLGQ